MYALRGDTPRQYCSHRMHDGWAGVPATRALWPLYGFEESVTTYFARVDKAVREAGLPDLSTLEVL
jgi:hypothetical protein